MRNKMLWIGISVGIVLGLLLAMSGVALAGSLAPSVGPTGAASQMYTLEQIWQRLNNGAAGAKMSSFTEPAVAPGTSTMHTLDDLMAAAPAVDATNGATTANVASGKTFWGLTAGQWGLQTGSAYPAPVPRTGQTGGYTTGDDGELKKGVPWPSPRFTDNNNGTVTDNLTGLIWLKNANCNGSSAFYASGIFVSGLASGACGLTDGSVAGDWRMPNVRELLSLVDYSQSNPPLPAGHPFSNFPMSGKYWTSTGKMKASVSRYFVDLRDAHTDEDMGGGGIYFVWPVRGEQ